MTTDWTGADRWIEAQRAAIEAWRDATSRLVDAQAQALLGALDGRAGTDPQALLRRWTDTQRELWQAWLAVAGGTEGETGPEAARQDMLEGLREAAEHLVRSQAEWARAWTAAESDPDRESRP
jgi:hypothetical protein